MELHLPNSETLTIVPESESYRIRRIMGENSITLKWKTTDFIEVPTGTYVTFQGQRYTLYSPENFKKRGTRIYEYTLLLETYQAIARRFRVKDATGKTKFNFTGTPRDLLDLFVWNMNQRDSGWTRGSYIEAEPKLISFDGNTVTEGVQMGADAFGTEFSFDGKVISYGKVEFNKSAPLALSYGRGNGFLPGVGRENSSDTEAFEILNVQGGNRNIDASRYGNDVLLLPLSQTIGFDGSKFSDETGFVAANARYYVTDAQGLTVRRSDKALSTYAEACFDGTKIYPTIAHSILKVETEVETVDGEEVTFYNIIIDAVEALDYRDCQIAGETATVIFQSGMLTGREFSLETKSDGTLDIEKYSDNGTFVGWRLKLCQDEQDGYIMPGGSFVPVVGGTVKVFGIQLPAAYICDNTSKTGASWSLFRDAVRFMFDNEDPKYSFSGTLDGIYSKANWTTIGPKVVPGGYVSFSDSQFLPDGALIRIVGIRESIDNPYSPTLELSNGAVHSSFASQMAALENTENKIDAAQKDAIAYTRRSWRDAKETQALLEKALLQEFTTTISPISINTMQMLVGSESLQYGWIRSLTDDTIVDHVLSFDSNGNLVCPAGVIKHYEMGITDVQPNRTVSSFMRWSVAAATLAFTSEDKAFYLYIKAQRLNAAGTGTATFVLSEEPIALEAVSGYWHFLYATIGSVMDGERSIFTANGFTEIGPGRITAYKFISPDGLQYLDFLTKAFRVGDSNAFIQFDSNSSRFLLRGTMIQSPSGDVFPVSCFRGEYGSTTSYYYGDEVTYNGESWLHIGTALTNGVAPGTDATVWQKKSARGADRGQFKSIVFKRNATKPATPTGGSYSSPVPDGWSDGVPSGEAILWMSTCIFTFDGSATPAWTEPAQVTDTADIDFEFSAVEENPGTPTSNPSNWHDVATGSDIWMAVRKCENGVWGSWEVTKVKGERGANGTSVLAQYSADGATGWHNSFVAGDNYMRTSTDGGATWSSAIRIVGEDGGPGADGSPGNYTDYSFAYSPNLTSSQADGCPTDSGTDGSSGNRITTWYDAPPANAVSGQYLWMRVVDKAWNAATEEYDSGTPAYARIGGENGSNGADGNNGKVVRGVSEWTSAGWGGGGVYQGETNSGDATIDGNFIDVVSYQSNYYWCYKTHRSGSILPTNTTYWTLMNQFQLIATRALVADQIAAKQVTIDNLNTGLSSGATVSRVLISGNKITVEDSSGGGVVQITGGNDIGQADSSGSFSKTGSHNGSGSVGDFGYDATVFSSALAITSGNNKASISAFSCTLELYNGADQVELDQFANIYAYLENLTTGESIFLGQYDAFAHNYAHLSVPAQSLAGLSVGSWQLKVQFMVMNEPTGLTVHGSVSSVTLSGQYISSVSYTKIAGNGFESLWSGEGIRVTSDGAKVIRGGDVYEMLGGGALNGLTAPKSFIVCTAYPSTLDANAFYLKVSAT